MATDLASANSADPAESVLADPSDGLDNSAQSWDFDEEQDEASANLEVPEAGNDSNSETDEAQQSQEADTETAEGDDTEAEGKASAEPDDSIVIAMPGGEKLELKELKSGYLRDRDYRHKTTDLANKRRDLEAVSTRVNQTVNAVSELLMSQVPPAPHHSLSLTDPTRYLQEKAQHEAALGIVQQIVEHASTAKTAVNAISHEQTEELLRSEVANLESAFPQIKTDVGKRQFFDGALSAAREIGFSDQELGQVTDHRMFKTLHYAKLGMLAEANKAKAAAKVQNVPPVAQQKRQQGPNAAKLRANQDAMKRVRQSGSLQDAMAVDFD